MKIKLMRLFFVAICGLIFGLGLTISGMLNPYKVYSFLNIFGIWDPSLAFVMMGGILVNACGYYGIIRKRQKPIFTENFLLPSKKNIDSNLIIGSAIFGIGWGIAGLCPGPVISNVFLHSSDAFLFLTVMMIGLWLGKKLKLK